MSGYKTFPLEFMKMDFSFSSHQCFVHSGVIVINEGRATNAPVNTRLLLGVSLIEVACSSTPHKRESLLIKGFGFGQNGMCSAGQTR